MSIATYYPLMVTEQQIAAPVRQGKAATTLITVKVTMPHVKKYGKPPTMSLTYGCSFDVEVGDRVLCPPTRLNPKWTQGTVTDLKANGHRGPAKYVAELGRKKGRSMDTAPALITAMRPAANVVDVAEHILELGGEMETQKLQALVYLSQAHHLAWCGRPLFEDPIEAWAEGPIVPALHELHAEVTVVGPGFFYAKLRETAAVADPEGYFAEDLREVDARAAAAHGRD